jgi:glyoxylase I family protein
MYLRDSAMFLFMIVGLHHVGLSVPNLEEAITFYKDVLGFTEVFDNSWDGDRPAADQAIGLEKTSAKMQMLRAGDACIELWEYENPSPASQDPNYSPANHGWAHIALQVTDIFQEYERLTEAGMTFHRPPVTNLGQGDSAAIYGRDPFGNIVELYEP